MRPDEEQERPQVLLAEDDERLRKAMAGALRRRGFGVTELADGARLLQRVERWVRRGRRGPLHAIVSGVQLPSRSGLDALSRLRASDTRLPFVLVTGHADRRTIAAAFENGATALLQRPFDLDMFRRLIERVVDEGPTVKMAGRR
jgi:DNA-binding NtrC family response regulator